MVCIDWRPTSRKPVSIGEKNKILIWMAIPRERPTINYCAADGEQNNKYQHSHEYMISA